MTVSIKHASLTGAAANPNALVDGPKWDAEHTVTGLGTAAVVNTGTSGTNVPLLDGINTWSSVQNLAANARVGGGAYSSDDSALLVNRALTPASGLLNSHGVRDETIAMQAVTASGFSGYAALDAAGQVVGSATTPMNHIRNFQARMQYNSSGHVNEMAGLWVGHVVNNAGAIVDQMYGVHVINNQITAGAVSNQYAYYADTLSGATNNYGVVIGNNPSTFGGTITAPQFLTPQAAVGGLAQIDTSPQNFLALVGVGNAALITGNGYYLLYICEVSLIAQAAFYTLAGGTVGGPLGAGANWVASTTTPGANNYSVAYDGSVGYRVYSNHAGTSNFKFVAIRIA